jgi:hypothetical protein
MARGGEDNLELLRDVTAIIPAFECSNLANAVDRRLFTVLRLIESIVAERKLDSTMRALTDREPVS